MLTTYAISGICEFQLILSMAPSNFNSCFAFVFFFFTFLGKKIVLNCTFESTSVLNGNYISGKMLKIFKIVSKCLQSNQV